MGIGAFLKRVLSFSKSTAYDESREAAQEERLRAIDPDRKDTSEAFMFALEGVFERMKRDGRTKEEAERVADSWRPPNRHLARQAVARVYEGKPLSPEEQEFRNLYNQIYGDAPWMHKGEKTELSSE